MKNKEYNFPPTSSDAQDTLSVWLWKWATYTTPQLHIPSLGSALVEIFVHR